MERNRRKPQGHYTDVPHPPDNPKGKDEKGKGAGKDKILRKKGKDQKGIRIRMKEATLTKGTGDDDRLETRAQSVQISLQIEVVLKVTNVRRATPRKWLTVSGAEGHSVAKCRRPRRDNPRNSKGKGEGRYKGKPKGKKALNVERVEEDTTG
eukprot:3652035-Amphidinium_carterae.1